MNRNTTRYDLISFDDDDDQYCRAQAHGNDQATSTPMGNDQLCDNPELVRNINRLSMDPERLMQLERETQSERQRHEMQMLELHAQLERERRHFEIERLRLQSEAPSHTKRKEINIEPLRERDDIEVYLTSFERLAEANKWHKSEMAPRLAAALTGKARQAYTRMSLSDVDDYTKLREAVLAAYDLTPEVYRKKFCEVKKAKDETHSQFAVRTRTLFERWVKGEKADSTIDNLQELLIKEQMLESYYPSLQLYLKDHRPKSLKELVEMADHY